MSRPAIWLPFLVIAATELAALALLVYFHRDGVVTLMEPVVQRLGGETATHYPGFFFLLPKMFAQVGRVIAVLVASIAGGVATVLFAREFGLKVEQGAWRRALRHALTLVLLAALAAGLVYGVVQLTAFVPRDQFLTSRWVRWGTRLGVLLGVTLISSFLAYSTAWVVLQGHRFFGAIRDSLRVTARTFLPTLFVVGIPLCLLYPLSYLAQRPDLFATKLRPEAIAGILWVRIGMELVLGFLVVGAITRLFMWRMGTSR